MVQTIFEPIQGIAKKVKKKDFFSLKNEINCGYSAQSENASIAVAFPFPNCCNLVGVPCVGGDGSLQRVPGQEDIAVAHQSSPGTNAK